MLLLTLTSIKGMHPSFLRVHLKPLHMLPHTTGVARGSSALHACFCSTIRHPIDSPSSSQEVMKTISLNTANQKQITQHKIRNAMAEHQLHILDTGSSSVQSTSI